MDKELIAMCDCPEIQENIFEPNEYTAIVAHDGGLPVDGDIVYILSVSWLLREIEVGEHQVVKLWTRLRFCASFSDESKERDNFVPRLATPLKRLCSMCSYGRRVKCGRTESG